MTILINFSNTADAIRALLGRFNLDLEQGDISAKNSLEDVVKIRDCAIATQKLCADYRKNGITLYSRDLLRQLKLDLDVASVALGRLLVDLEFKLKQLNPADAKFKDAKFTLDSAYKVRQTQSSSHRFAFLLLRAAPIVQIDKICAALDYQLEGVEQLAEGWLPSLELEIQAEPSTGDPLECTHFDQWGSDLWNDSSCINTAHEVLSSWSEVLQIPAIAPDSLSGGAPWSVHYLLRGHGQDFPNVLRDALDIILKDGRFAAYASNNFIEIYGVESVWSDLAEAYSESVAYQLVGRAIQRQAEVAQQLPNI